MNSIKDGIKAGLNKFKKKNGIKITSVSLNEKDNGELHSYVVKRNMLKYFKIKGVKKEEAKKYFYHADKRRKEIKTKNNVRKIVQTVLVTAPIVAAGALLGLSWLITIPAGAIALLANLKFGPLKKINPYVGQYANFEKHDKVYDAISNKVSETAKQKQINLIK